MQLFINSLVHYVTSSSQDMQLPMKDKNALPLFDG